MKFAGKIALIEPSATLAITSKAKELIAAGQDVVILAAGEPDYDTPDNIKEAAIKAIKRGDTKYTPESGTKALKDAVCRKLKRDNALDYSAANIVISNGAKHSIYNVLQVLCSAGDEVLIVSPYWLSYPEMVKLADGTPVIIKTDLKDGFKVTPGKIRSVLTKRTKILVINSPSNPAGVVYTEKELAAIADICVKNNIVMLSDEIYEKIIFDGMKHCSVASSSPEAKRLTVLVNGVSKSYSMTGWRIGYIACDAEIAKMVSTLQGQSTSNPCSISQAAAEYALSADMEKEMAAWSEEFRKRRDFLIKSFDGVSGIRPFKPAGAFYLFCDVSSCGLDSLTFSKRLLEEKKVAVIPGGPFGEDGFIRLSFATDMNTLHEGAERIKEWVKDLL